MKSLPEYAKTKDKCCIIYLGPNWEYLVQLDCLLPYIRTALPGLHIDVYGHQEFKNVSHLKKLNKADYGFVYELTYDLEHHPLMHLLESCKVQISPVSQPSFFKTDLCIICPNALLPNKPLTSRQIMAAKDYAKSRGLVPKIEEDITNASLVIGPENGPLYLAASKGIKTALIPTGLGEQLYKRMFPHGEILKIT